MAQHHLGERVPYTVRVSEKVDCKALAAAAGYSNVSRWGADMFAKAAGLPGEMLGPDLVVDQEAMLPISA